MNNNSSEKDNKPWFNRKTGTIISGIAAFLALVLTLFLYFNEKPVLPGLILLLANIILIFVWQLIEKLPNGTNKSTENNNTDAESKDFPEK